MTTDTLTDRELDFWLAEHLFGWLWVEHAGTRKFMPPWARDSKNFDYIDARATFEPHVRYSSTGDGMWLVIETMRERGFSLEVYTVVPTDLDLPANQWAMTATFRRLNGGSSHAMSGLEESPDHSLPRAVALAARTALQASRLDA